MSDQREGGPRLPPRFIIRLAWSTHRAIYRVTGGRVGLWRPKPRRWGTLRLTTTGRRTGRPRSVILGYFQDGPNLVTLAMNGWADPEPAWWLNLQAQPDATVELVGGSRAVRARAAQGAERSRLRPTAPLAALGITSGAATDEPDIRTERRSPDLSRGSHPMLCRMRLDHPDDHPERSTLRPLLRS